MSARRAITTAIIPAAGLDTRLMPASLAAPKAMFPIAQSDGRVRPVIHIIAREALAAGIERIGIVVAPGGDERMRAYFRDHRQNPRLASVAGMDAELAELADLAGRITYITQPEPAGFGHAVWCAAEFAAHQPVLVMLGDHLYLPDHDAPPATVQVAKAFAEMQPVSVIGVTARPAAELHLHGAVGGAPVESAPVAGLFRVHEIIEKPDPSTARTRLTTPTVAEGNYLTHAGVYAFSEEIFAVLHRMVGERSSDAVGEIQLTTAQQRLLAGDGETFAVEIVGRSLDMGNPAAMVAAQMAMWAAGGQ